MSQSTRPAPRAPKVPAAPGTASGSPVHVVVACYLGWMLDSFDFFIMVFVLDTVAKTFGVGVGATAWALTATLACRVVGAALFGRLADRFGRRPVMMINVLSYATLELLSGFAPSFTVFLVLRALFGVAMGGEWGVGASLAMESIPGRWRGLVSGVLQTGYPTGYLLASLLFAAEPWLGWRGMFVAGALPALLVLYIRRTVPESPDWHLQQARVREPIGRVLSRHKGLTLYAVVLLTAMLFFSHGSQDLYPKLFLAGYQHLQHHVVVWMMVGYNLGAIAGGLLIGLLSQRIGRKLALAGAALLALPAIPFWAFGHGVPTLVAGGFVLQFAVQGAWGVIPAFLNELSPATIRATFPGVVYQLGNLFASPNANLQVWMMHRPGSDIRWALGLVIAVVATLVSVLVMFAPDTRQVRMGAERLDPEQARGPEQARDPERPWSASGSVTG